MINYLKSLFKPRPRQGIVNKMRANLEFSLATKGQRAQMVALDHIPTQWEKFADTEDLWIKVPFPKGEDYSACLYIGRAGSYFPKHMHTVHEEMVVYTPGAQVKVYTKKGSRILGYLEGAHFAPQEEHAVKFITETKILCIWHPSFKQGWQAQFTKQESK